MKNNYITNGRLALPKFIKVTLIIGILEISLVELTEKLIKENKFKHNFKRCQNVSLKSIQKLSDMVQNYYITLGMGNLNIIIDQGEHCFKLLRNLQEEIKLETSESWIQLINVLSEQALDIINLSEVINSKFNCNLFKFDLEKIKLNSDNLKNMKIIGFKDTILKLNYNIKICENE